MANVLWLQGGACSGNTMSFLNAEEPSVVDLILDFGLNILWHPSLGNEIGAQVQDLLERCVSGDQGMDIFVFEGSVIQAPEGTGNWNRFAGKPMKDWVHELAHAAQFVVAIGDCATWGGIPATAPNPSDSTGLQFLKRSHGGFLGPEFRSKAGLPVINIPGCPAHPDWISQILVEGNEAFSDRRVRGLIKTKRRRWWFFGRGVVEEQVLEDDLDRIQVFYRKHGYEAFGQLEDYPPGHQRMFFQKRLD